MTHVSQPWNHDPGAYRIEADRESLEAIRDTIQAVLDGNVPNEGIGLYANRLTNVSLQFVLVVPENAE